jgi:hypothetical protein
MKPDRLSSTNLRSLAPIPITQWANIATSPSQCPVWEGYSRFATPTDPESSASSVHTVQPVLKGNFMKKTKDEMRTEYKRSDFTKLERGKFYKEVAKGTSVALLDPAIAKVFPTSEAVNAALLGLLTLTEQTARITAKPKRAARKPA